MYSCTPHEREQSLLYLHYGCNVADKQVGKDITSGCGGRSGIARRPPIVCDRVLNCVDKIKIDVDVKHLDLFACPQMTDDPVTNLILA